MWDDEALRVTEKHSFPFRPWGFSHSHYWHFRTVHVYSKILTQAGWIGNIAMCDYRVNLVKDFLPRGVNDRPVRACKKCTNILKRAGLIA